MPVQGSHNRYRADLIEVAFGRERSYSNAVVCDQQIGLINSGITLPDPSYEWTPFYGVGVDNRNILFPVQGRQTLQGSISNIMLTHRESLFMLEQALGVAFRNDESLPLTVSSINDKTLTYSNTSLASNYDDSSDTAQAIVILTGTGSNDSDIYNATWAYVKDVGNTSLTVSQTRDTSGSDNNGWIGKIPIRDTNTLVDSVRLYKISSGELNDTGANVRIRESLIQPSFSMAARFASDNGQTFIRRYLGCKVNRLTLNYNEGQPVTMNIDFIAQQVQTDDLNNSITGIDSNPTDNSIPTTDLVWRPITSQPYFFSNIDLHFNTTPFARFRSFTVTIDNQLDPFRNS